MQDEKKGLNNTTIVLMICVALFYDALQWLLGFIFMGWLVTIFAGLTFYVWFKTRGMSFMKPKRFATFGGSFIIELIPIVGDILPTWTASITYLALDSKIKKVVGKIPGGEMAITAANNKMIRNKNMAQVNNMQRLTPMSKDKFDERRNKQKVELDKRTESERKEREERYKLYEERRQKQRETEERYGGHEKYNKDLTDLKYKYGTADKKEKDLADLAYKYKDSSRN